MSVLTGVSLAAWVLVTGTAAVFRGVAFATYTAMAVGLYTYAALALAPLAQATLIGPGFVALHALAYLHLMLFLLRPRMRGLVYRALVSLPGAAFLAGTMLALPWGIAAQLGARSPLFVASAGLPYLAALIGLLQSLTARGGVVHIQIDGRDAGPLSRHQPSSARAARPLRVAQISDPHLGPFMSVERLQRICADAVAADPDLILLTGDFLTMDSQESGQYLTQALAPLRPLAGRTFACRGNHDLEAPAIVEEALRANGVRLLIDDAVTACTPYGEVDLLGFDFVFRQRAAHVAAIAARHPRRSADVPRVALLHDPGSFQHLPPGAADLVLAGHLHGGQLGLFRMGGGWTLPRLARLPDHGLWARGRERLYVHRGNGHYGFPLRIGVPAEEAILHLHFIASDSAPGRPELPPSASESRAFRYDETMLIPRPPREVHAYLAAVERTPEWLSMCVRLEQCSPGPRGAGTRLHYVYRELGRERDMDGEVTAWEPDRRLAFRYVDHMHVIALEFNLSPAGDGGTTRLEHILTLESRHLLARLLWPLFRLALLRSWPRNLARLRTLLLGPGTPPPNAALRND